MINTNHEAARDKIIMWILREHPEILVDMKYDDNDLAVRTIINGVIHSLSSEVLGGIIACATDKELEKVSLNGHYSGRSLLLAAGHAALFYRLKALAQLD